MDLIYGGSIFTIIAAAGNNVETGLPGVKPGSRRPQQYIEEISSNVKLLLLVSPEAKLERSVHQTRGWTFQEKILSRRRFIFLDDTAYFQCERRMCREDFCERRPDVVSAILQNADRNTSEDSYFGTRPGRAYSPGGIWERLVQAYLRRSLSVESDIIRAFQGLLRTMEQRLKLHFLAGMPIEYLDSSLLWAPRRHAKRRLGFPSFSWAGWTGEAIWPAQDGISHPFISFALADNKSWYLNDTYIEWHQCSDGAEPELIRSGSEPAYSWLASHVKGIKSKHKGEKLVMDATGRPLDLKWEETKDKKKKNKDSKENFREPNPRETLPQEPSGGVHWHQKPPREISLCFPAVVVNVLLEEGNINPQYVDNFRFLALKCQHGSTHGFVAVPDQFQCPVTAQGSVIVLSNAFPGSTLPFSDSNSSEAPGIKAKAANKPAYYVMLVERRVGGVAERVGTGILMRGALTCELLMGSKWEYVFLI
jgi:hypothetical protein